MPHRDEEEEEESPRHKRGKGGGKRWLRLVSIGVIVFLSICGLFYIYNAVSNPDIEGSYTMCLSQNRVLDERFADCSRQLLDCNSNAGNPAGT